MRDDVSVAERSDFGSPFLLCDLAIATNLLTPALERSAADMLAHDQAALEQIDCWFCDALFDEVHQGLHEIAQRLNEQIMQAGLPAASLLGSGSK